MIEVNLKVDENHICHTNYNIEGYTTLNDVALILLEMNKIKQILLDESKNYKPIMEMKKMNDIKQKVFKKNIVEEIIVIKKDGWDSERATEIVDNVIDNFSKGDKVKISVTKL